MMMMMNDDNDDDTMMMMGPITNSSNVAQIYGLQQK